MVWFRDTDGKLCTSAYDDRRRWMQTFLNRRLRSSHIPVMFSEAHINNPLELQHYKYILERACLQFEPDDPEFVRVFMHPSFDSMDAASTITETATLQLSKCFASNLAIDTLAGFYGVLRVMLRLLI
ncbi:hypothetical protein GJ496_000136 [Pomphorhynchus laevis]|nr:hypothetical protein GJ496_000136 [Pomphorhynchus laevis]